MRGAVIGLVIAVLVGGCCHSAPAGPGHAPPVPDLSGYAEVRAEDYLGPEDYFPRPLYFRTPDGLVCTVNTGSVDCTGNLPGDPPANEVSLGGFRQAAQPQAGPPAGFTPKLLPAGHTVSYQEVRCAAGDDATTRCVAGSPPTRWFVLTPQSRGIGPRTGGLPTGFPDPLDFVEIPISDIAAPQPKKTFPVFTVASGLTCQIMIFSGYRIGCDGVLPTADHGENEIYLIGMGGVSEVGLRKTGQPGFSTPRSPEPLRQLPAQHRITDGYENGATCMATADGGVACYVGLNDPADRRRGFVAAPTAAWTFG